MLEPDLSTLALCILHWPREWRTLLVGHNDQYVTLAINTRDELSPFAWIRLFHNSGLCCVWLHHYTGEPVTRPTLEKAIDYIYSNV